MGSTRGLVAHNVTEAAVDVIFDHSVATHMRTRTPAPKPEPAVDAVEDASV